MDRRTFLGTLTSGLLAVSLVAEAQQPRKVLPRIAFLGNADAKNAVEPLDACREGLTSPPPPLARADQVIE